MMDLNWKRHWKLVALTMITVAVGCGNGLDQKGKQSSDNSNQKNTDSSTSLINYNCQQACEHLWWCHLMDLESVDECTASCEAKSDKNRWLTCVRDTPQCPADIACVTNPTPSTSSSPPAVSSNCEKLCGLGYGCQMIPAAGLEDCSTKCESFMAQVTDSIKSCFESAQTCTDLRKCNCSCDIDSTCTNGCECDPECGDTIIECVCDNSCPKGCEEVCKDVCSNTCTCNTSASCDSYCDCDSDCKKFGEKCTDTNECGDQNYSPEHPICYKSQCTRTCVFSTICPTGTTCTELSYSDIICTPNAQ